MRRDVAVPPLSARGLVTLQRDGRYRLELVLDTPEGTTEKVLEDQSCVVLGRAAALVLGVSAGARPDTEDPAPEPAPVREETIPATLAEAYFPGESTPWHVGEELSPRRAPPPGPVAVRVSPRRGPAGPSRPSFELRAIHAQIGSTSGAFSGRMWGAQGELGQTWRWWGWALGGTVLGGEAGTTGGTSRVSTLAGGGPTLTIGRLAMVRHGMLDLRAGYDVMGTRVVRDLAGDAMSTSAGALIVHGPRAHLVLRLLGTRDPERRFFHAAGAVVGYQLLLGGIRGHVPPTHMLQVGLSYWLG
jgi:hypothetical protein